MKRNTNNVLQVTVLSSQPKQAVPSKQHEPSRQSVLHCVAVQQHSSAGQCIDSGACLYCFHNSLPQPDEVPCQGSEPTKGQWRLNPTCIPYLEHSVKGGGQGAIPIGWEPAKQDAERLKVAQTHFLQSNTYTEAQHSCTMCQDLHPDGVSAAHHACNTC